MYGVLFDIPADFVSFTIYMSAFDTATLCGLAYGQTVLAKAAAAAGIDWNSAHAHSAIYDAEQTADLFCTIVNTWNERVGVPAKP